MQIRELKELGGRDSKSLNIIITICDKTIKEYQCARSSFFSVSGNKGLARLHSFCNLSQTIKNCEPEEALIKLYQFYKKNYEKNSKFIRILQRNLASLWGIEIPEFILGIHGGNAWEIIGKVQQFEQIGRDMLKNCGMDNLHDELLIKILI